MEDPVIETENKVLGKTFFYMFLGLLATALVSWYIYASGYINNLILGGTFRVMLVIELLVVIVFNLLFKKLPPIGVAILYFIYAFVNGVTFSVFFAVFELNSIIYLFFAAAVLFGIFAFMGYNSKKDLSSWSSYILPLLIVGLIVSLINLFVNNSMIDIILDWFVLILFFGITMYDMNKIKELANSGIVENDKVYIYGAMELYLDFINIFIRLLSIFGKRKD